MVTVLARQRSGVQLPSPPLVCFAWSCHAISFRVGTRVCSLRTPHRMSYAGVGGPNQAVSASASPSGVRSPTQAT